MNIEYSFADYEAGSVRCQIFASNGEFSGTLTVYTNENTLITFFQRLSVYDGTPAMASSWHEGDMTERYAYGLIFDVAPVSKTGATKIHVAMLNGHSKERVEFHIDTDPGGCNELGLRAAAALKGRSRCNWPSPSA